MKDSNVVILANHGTVSFGETVEKAYWWTENSRCLLQDSHAFQRSWPCPPTFQKNETTKNYLPLKQQWGFKDPRLEKSMENCDICANDVFRTSWGNTGVSRSAFDPPPAMNAVSVIKSEHRL